MTATSTTDVEEVASPLNPFMPLTREPINLAIPKDRKGRPDDYYTWVCYFLDGNWAAEFDARGEQYGWSRVGDRPVLAIDLVPVGYDCPVHKKRAREECPHCIEMWRRGRLSIQRVLVPAGMRAVFFRRRYVPIGPLPEGVEIIQNWTAIGYEESEAKLSSLVGLDGQTLVDGGVKGTYLFFDESGRSLLTNDKTIV